MTDPVTAIELPHWHEFNPWNDHLVYVPLEELAACSLKFDGLVPEKDPWTMIEVLAYWMQYGDKLDAYILTGPTLTAGIRYGSEGSHYLSPGFSLPRLAALLRQYQPKKKPPKTIPIAEFPKPVS